MIWNKNIYSAAPSYMEFSSEVRSEQHNLALSECLAIRFAYYSREQWLKIIQNGQIKVEGEVCTEDRICPRYTKLTYCMYDYTEPMPPVQYQIAWQNEDYLIIEKAAGTPVHKTGRIFYNTLSAILERDFQQSCIPIHRLDRETGGLVVFARHKEAARQAQPILSEVLQRKIYLAVCAGDFSQVQNSGEQNIFQYTDCRLALRDKVNTKFPIRMEVDAEGKECHSRFYPLLCSSTHSLIAVELFSGRKHQIRAHAAALGHPLIGDKLYSHNGDFYKTMLERELEDSDYKTLGAKHHLLHAAVLQLKLPGCDEIWVQSQHLSPEFKPWLQQWPNWEERLQRFVQDIKNKD
jgi:23S rRNA pseudouridine1911/1915/1917 synthase